ncbi:hypothetical protein PQX77_011350 [Marasmius sp. AFHP31]|nr:hypothetical protein PQX77_011350 [Marasmius sp. AFHP31]
MTLFDEPESNPFYDWDALVPSHAYTYAPEPTDSQTNPFERRRSLAPRLPPPTKFRRHVVLRGRLKVRLSSVGGPYRYREELEDADDELDADADGDTDEEEEKDELGQDDSGEEEEEPRREAARTRLQVIRR